MDASLARGYARATIASYPDGDGVLDALHQKPKSGATVAPMLGAKSRRPPNTTKLFAAQHAYVHPTARCFVAAWSPELCHVVGWTVTGMQRLHLVARDGNAELEDTESLLLLRSEASLLYPADLLRLDSDHANLTVGYSASISRHALQRLLQREGTTPAKLRVHALRALVLADTAQRHAQVTKAVGQDFGGTFLLPWKDGALVASATRIRIRQDAKRTCPHLSIRTYLDARKLSARDQGRMLDLAGILAHHKLQDLGAFHSMMAEVSPKGPEHAVWRAALHANKDDREYRPQNTPQVAQDANA
jgi:hypothetical protein